MRMRKEGKERDKNTSLKASKSNSNKCKPMTCAGVRYSHTSLTSTTHIVKHLTQRKLLYTQRMTFQLPMGSTCAYAQHLE